MKLALSVGLTFAFTGLGIVAVLSAASPNRIGAIITIIVITQAFLLAPDWGPLSIVVRRGTIIGGLISLLLLAAGQWVGSQALEMAARFVCAGISSVSLLAHKTLDQLMRLIFQKCNSLPGPGEAVLLYRNSLPAAIHDLWLGFRASPQASRPSIRDKIRNSFLFAVVLAARVPATSSDLLSATYIRQFSVRKVALLGLPSLRFHLALIIGSSMILLVAFG